MGVAGGNIDGLELRGCGLTRPTESERGGADNMEMLRSFCAGGGGESEVGCGDMNFASRAI